MLSAAPTFTLLTYKRDAPEKRDIVEATTAFPRRQLKQSPSEHFPSLPNLVHDVSAHTHQSHVSGTNTYIHIYTNTVAALGEATTRHAAAMQSSDRINHIYSDTAAHPIMPHTNTRVPRNRSGNIRSLAKVISARSRRREQPLITDSVRDNRDLYIVSTSSLRISTVKMLRRTSILTWFYSLLYVYTSRSARQSTFHSFPNTSKIVS